jgi:integrase
MRRSGGVRAVRDGVWRVDVEVPRATDGPRRRVSRTVEGTLADAEAALVQLRAEINRGCTPSASDANDKHQPGRRSRGSGTVAKRGHDRWFVQFDGPPDTVTGDRRRHSRTVHGTRADAEAALARLRVDVGGGTIPVGTNARDVRAACELYMRDVRTEKNTQRTDRSAINRLCATILPGGTVVADLPLSRLDWQTIERIYDAWAREVSPQGRARYASTVSKVLEHAKRIGWITSNPAKEARRPRVPAHRPDVPDDADVRAALAAVRERDFLLYAYVLGLATIGCRRGELLAIKVEDLDLRRGVVSIRAALADGGPGTGIYYKATKRNDWRDVPLTEQIVEVLSELLDQRRVAGEGTLALRPDSFVFSDDIEGLRWLRPDTTSQRWLAVRGASKVTLAMLRRYVATQLLDATNGDYRTVASITGNSEETLRRWYDAGPNLEKKAAIRNLGRL